MNLLRLSCLVLFATALFTGQLRASSSSGYLLKCLEKQVVPLHKQFLYFFYEEKLNKLEHSFAPWQQTHYAGKGSVWCGSSVFLKQDTLASGARNYYSRTDYNKTDMLLLDYGDKTLYPVTPEMHLDEVFLTARYAPVCLLNYCSQHKTQEIIQDQFAIYQITINKTIVRLFIRRSDCLLAKVTTLSNDELFGDVLSTITYSDYALTAGLSYPKTITIEKINGKLKDEVSIKASGLTDTIPVAAQFYRPPHYAMKEAVPVLPEVTVDHYNSHIHFLELKHTDDKVMVVEFSNFLLVAEAPLNSENGELILREARRIAPGKPVRYFVFGHYHPHYLGGMRPFIHAGAKILCTTEDREFVEYLAATQHTLYPDSLQLSPKALQTEQVGESRKITDGSFEMDIYHIGKLSEHTSDYLVYYFPQEKLLFEDDLVWIAKQGEIKKAGVRQAGLYKAVHALGLDIKTIVQSWPVAEAGVKTVIPFEDLEKSVMIK